MTPDADEQPSKKRPSILRWVLTVVAVALLAFFLWDRRDELSRAFHTSWENLALLILLNAVGQTMNATEFWMLYRAGGAPVRWLDNYSSFNAAQLGNYLPMQAGSVYRMHFHRRIDGVSFPRSLTTYAQNLVITVAAGGVVGVIGVCATAAFTGRDFSVVMALVFVAMLSGAAFFAFVPLPHARWLPGRVQHWWQDFHSGWELVRQNPRSAAAVLGVELGRMLVSAARLQIAFVVLGVHAPFVLYLVLAPVASVSTILAITPGAIGIREGAIAAAALAVNFKLPTGLLAASVDRGASLLVVIVLGLIGYGHMTSRLSKHA